MERLNGGLQSMFARMSEDFERQRYERESLAMCPMRPAAHAKELRRAAVERDKEDAARRKWCASLPVPGIECVYDVTHEQTPAVVAVERWLAGPRTTPWNVPIQGLVLRGGVGCGKSLAAALAARCIGGNAVWLRPDELVSAVLHSYDESSPKLKPLVIVDDIGRETKADFIEALCAVLDNPEHTLLGTTNLTQAQMRERYDVRLLDRLNHRCVAVDVPGRSLRRQGGGF